MGFLNYEIVKTFSSIFELLNINGYLVGGAVRDILMGFEPIDFDFLSELDENEHYETTIKIAEILKCDFKYNSFFHTAKFFYKGFDVDFVMARSEKYLDTSSKPIIKSAGIIEDLKRRDFTINSIAVSLKDEKFEIIDPFNGIEDIKNKKLKILHKKSFKDDPTRIFRGIKYASRFEFDFEDKTKKSLEEALYRGYLLKLPRSRIRLEMESLFNEKNVLLSCAFLKRYKILESIIKSNIYIFTDYDKIKFSRLSFKDKLILIFYKNEEEVLNSLKDFLCLGENFIDEVINIKNIENKLLKCDFEVYKYLFNKRNIKDEVLDVAFEKDIRIQNYIKYKNLIKIDISDILNLPEEKRKEYISLKKAESMITLQKIGGQDHV
ncbi:CCA tRNA nucleotidyltransferase [Caloramator sp. E03]|uniref:CCA tRNA nucleotidyltransferase n=1 Tax=Caloramator sp. E03 TaxID=2576307 RepID=UPI001110F38C|nr:CCA tRNA nucleotidyltransferase [Caloramator sp. E03]QCX32662.1 CCA tRNA nucleotidyltransferase [Caloramator sp. E03]